MSVDNLIDRVARELTAAQAPDLSGRVRKRIAATPQPRPWRWTLIPLTGLAAGALVLAVINTRPDDSGSGFRESGELELAKSAAPELPESRIPESENPRIPESQNPRVPVSSSAAEWQARAVPALPAVAPLAIDRIQPIPLSIPLLQVEPLVVPPIGDDR